MVQYWKRGDTAKAKPIVAEDGSYQLQIEGEKEVYPGFPRGHFLTGPMAAIKNKIKNELFNSVFAEMQKVQYDQLPPDKMVPAVRHIWETFEKLEEMEIVPDMRARIKLIKTVLCGFLNEDDAYRFRAQAFLDFIEQKKVALSKADLYYARGKYWRPDRYKKVLGKVVDGFEY